MDFLLRTQNTRNSVGVERAAQLFFGEAVAALLAVVPAVGVHVVNHLHVLAGGAAPTLAHHRCHNRHVQRIHKATLTKGSTLVNRRGTGINDSK
jgi:hypothetical protein